MKSILLLFCSFLLCTNCISGNTESDQSSDCGMKEWKAGMEISRETIAEKGGAAAFFSSNMIDSLTFRRIYGLSFKKDCTIELGDLRYLHLLHTDLTGRILTGEMVCNKAIAEDLLDIFLYLFKEGYPIERIQLVDDFEADDELSMEADNSSSFNYRPVPLASGGVRISKHGYGMAVDINPLYNPYVKGGTVLPVTATGYTDRSKNYPYKIEEGDICVKAFLDHDFEWGGAWETLKDYQNFEKDF